MGAFKLALWACSFAIRASCPRLLTLTFPNDYQKASIANSKTMVFRGFFKRTPVVLKKAEALPDPAAENFS